MALKSGWGGGKGMNGTRTAKNASGATKARKPGTGTRGAANKGYR